MSPFDPFRGGDRPKQTMSAFLTVFFVRELPLALINFTIELPQNTNVVQSEHTEQYSKVPMTAPSRGSLSYSQWIMTSSGACLGYMLNAKC